MGRKNRQPGDHRMSPDKIARLLKELNNETTDVHPKGPLKKCPKVLLGKPNRRRGGMIS